MSAWGSSSPFRSCDSLIQRIERNDPTLTDLVILPAKNFGADEVDRLCAVLENNTNIYWKSLSASGHAISVESLRKLGHAIAVNSSTPLSSLAVGDRSMGDEGVSTLCNELGQRHRLQTVDLSYKNMTSVGFCSVLETLGVSPTLTSLNLSRNPSIGQAAVDTTAAPLFENLIEFDLSDCGITSQFASQFFPKLAPGNVKRTLALSNNPLGPEGLRSLETLMGSISTLNVSNATLENMGMKVLLSFGSWAVESLDLSRNNVSLEGIHSLVSCLPRESGGSVTTTGLYHLRNLDLSSNPISEEGVCFFVSEGLAKSNGVSLRFLDLSETGCGIKGACVALDHSKASSLRLFNNQLGSDGFRALSELIQDIRVAPALESLDLAGNNADIDSVVCLLAGILNRESSESGPSQLRSLVIGGNASGTEVEEMVEKIRQVRPDLDVARDKSNKKT